MNENTLWKTLKKGMIGRWLPTRIETSTITGVPDVSYTMTDIHGWIELKYVPTWPKREATLIKLPLRPEQELWIKQHGKAAGFVFVICKIEKTTFLLDWASAIDACGGWNKADWHQKCLAHWNHRIDYDELEHWLHRRLR